MSAAAVFPAGYGAADLQQLLIGQRRARAGGESLVQPGTFRRPVVHDIVLPEDEPFFWEILQSRGASWLGVASPHAADTASLPLPRRPRPRIVVEPDWDPLPAPRWRQVLARAWFRAREAWFLAATWAGTW